MTSTALQIAVVVGVSAPYEDVNGQTDAGAVNVMYGGPAGLQTTSPNAQLLTGDSPGMPGSAVAGDQFGWTLSHGRNDLDLGRGELDRAPARHLAPYLDRRGMTFDRARKRIVLFGGLGPGELNDTWTWDGTNWEREA